MFILEKFLKAYIFITGPSGVGRSTLAKSLFEACKAVYIEQNIVPEFSIHSVVDVGIFEEEIFWKNTLSFR